MELGAGWPAEQVGALHIEGYTNHRTHRMDTTTSYLIMESSVRSFVHPFGEFLKPTTVEMVRQVEQCRGERSDPWPSAGAKSQERKAPLTSSILITLGRVEQMPSLYFGNILTRNIKTFQPP
jgi:hypothetical protein